MLVRAVPGTKQQSLTSPGHQQTPRGYSWQQNSTILSLPPVLVSTMDSRAVGEHQLWGLISRTHLCNNNCPKFTALERISLCSFKSEVTDCTRRKAAKRSQLSKSEIQQTLRRLASASPNIYIKHGLLFPSHLKASK